MRTKRFFSYTFFFLVSYASFAQADNEIQVYASPTIGKNRTIFELHSNRNFRGNSKTAIPQSVSWANETLEITHGFGDNFEIGFYTFTAFSPDGKYHYQGNQIRPRVSAPSSWNVPVGLSLSTEFGFFRPHADSSFMWQGEIRPIIDYTGGNWYFAFNPNVDFEFENGTSFGFAPQAKTVYAIKQKVGVGIEYYTYLGEFSKMLPASKQEHLLGAGVDLYLHPDVEINIGYFWGLTDYSTQRIFKLLLGYRIGK